jgi:hypothetical protein
MKRVREGGVVDWKAKLVLDWQADTDGYRIERRKGRPGLYVVANGGEPRHYTVHAWKEDILFDLANIAAPPFPWDKREEEVASDARGYSFSTVADEIVASPDGVVIERVLGFAKQWGLLSHSHVEQRLADFLGAAVDIWESFEWKEDGGRFISGLQCARVSGGRFTGAHASPEFDEQGRPCLLVAASTLSEFCSFEFMEYAGTSCSYFSCANPKCGRLGPTPKAVNPTAGGRPRKYCNEACEKVHSRLKAKGTPAEGAATEAVRIRARVRDVVVSRILASSG